MKKALPALIAALLLAFWALDPLMGYLLGLNDIWRYVWALLVLLPIGFLMGLPFTIGMRDLLSSTTQRAYAWSANAWVSVVLRQEGMFVGYAEGVLAEGEDFPAIAE